MGIMGWDWHLIGGAWPTWTSIDGLVEKLDTKKHQSTTGHEKHYMEPKPRWEWKRVQGIDGSIDYELVEDLGLPPSEYSSEDRYVPYEGE